METMEDIVTFDSSAIKSSRLLELISGKKLVVISSIYEMMQKSQNKNAFTLCKFLEKHRFLMYYSGKKIIDFCKEENIILITADEAVDKEARELGVKTILIQ